MHLNSRQINSVKFAGNAFAKNAWTIHQESGPSISPTSSEQFTQIVDHWCKYSIELTICFHAKKELSFMASLQSFWSVYCDGTRLKSISTSTTMMRAKADLHAWKRSMRPLQKKAESRSFFMTKFFIRRWIGLRTVLEHGWEGREGVGVCFLFHLFLWN